MSTLKPVRERFPSSPLSYKNKLKRENIVVSPQLVYPFVIPKDFVREGEEMCKCTVKYIYNIPPILKCRVLMSCIIKLDVIIKICILLVDPAKV